jgi:hypothetical protein
MGHGIPHKEYLKFFVYWRLSFVWCAFWYCLLFVCSCVLKSWYCSSHTRFVSAVVCTEEHLSSSFAQIKPRSILTRPPPLLSAALCPSVYAFQLYESHDMLSLPSMRVFLSPFSLVLSFHCTSHTQSCIFPCVQAQCSSTSCTFCIWPCICGLSGALGQEKSQS